MAGQKKATGKSTKDTSKFQNEFKDYDNIRHLIHHIYLYGIYSAEDITNSKLIDAKYRTVQDYIRRIRNSIIQMNSSSDMHIPITNHALPNRKKDKNSLQFSNDFIKAPNNPLFGTYRQHTINASDIFFYLYFFTILSSDDINPYEFLDLDPDGPARKACDSAYSKFQELVDSNIFNNNDIYEVIHAAYEANYLAVNELEHKVTDDSAIKQFPLSKKQCNDKLEELAALGILRKDVIDYSELNSDSKGNILLTYYSLSESIFEIKSKNSVENLNDLLEFVRYSSNYSPISVPGYLLSEKLDNYLMVNDFSRAAGDVTNNLAQINDLFLYEKTGIVNTVDDQICIELVEAINTRSLIWIKYQTDNYENQSDHLAFPIKIAIDDTYGRHYLIAFKFTKVIKKKKHDIECHVYSPEAYITLRIDRIAAISPALDIEFYDTVDTEFVNKIYDAYPLTKQYSYNPNASQVKVKKLNKNQINHKPVQIMFNFSDNSWEQYLKQKLLTHIRLNNKLTKIDDNHYRLETELTDVSEIVPFINSFGACAMVDSETSKELSKIINAHTMETLAAYESL